jgi:hypothetical protein
LNSQSKFEARLIFNFFFRFQTRFSSLGRDETATAQSECGIAFEYRHPNSGSIFVCIGSILSCYLALYLSLTLLPSSAHPILQGLQETFPSMKIGEGCKRAICSAWARRLLSR